MTNDQEQHLLRIKDNFFKEVDKKYRLGQVEHGGELWKKKGIIKMLKEEAVDLYVYADTLQEQLNEKKKL